MTGHVGGAVRITLMLIPVHAEHGEHPVHVKVYYADMKKNRVMKRQ